MTSFGEFNRIYSSIQPAFIHLARIVDSVGDFRPIFKTSWLSDVYGCVLVRSGIKKPEDKNNDCSFFDALCIASFGTYLINCVSETRYLFNPQLLYCSNIHQIFDFEPLGDEKQRFVRLAQTIDVPGFEKATKTLESNFKGDLIAVDGQYVADLMDEYFDEDYLSFKVVDGKTFQTWQEALLCDALRTSLSYRGIEPMMKLRNGSESPDTSAWTETVLSLAREAFDDRRAICIIETLEYCKQGKAPTEASQNLIVDLFLGHAKRCLEAGEPLRKLSCTTLRMIRSLLESKQLEEEPKRRYFKGLSELLSTVSDYDDICYMKENSLPCTEEQKQQYLSKTKRFAKESLSAVAYPQDLIAVFKDPRCARNCDCEDAKLAFELFLVQIQKKDIATAELFYWAMMFFIDVLDNPQVDNKWTRETLISLRRIWQDNYYATVIANMQIVSQEGSIPTAEVEDFNKAFLESPHSIAHSVFLQSDEAIASTLESMAEHAIVYLFGKTTISEYYPEHVHVAYEQNARSIDYMIASEIMRVYNENSYRFLNALEEQNVVDGFFENLSQRIEFCCSLIDIKPAYEWIVTNAPKQYELLPFPEMRPTLGHLTQLFPILENVIREIGELFAIMPFQADKETFTHLKNVTSVLADLIGEVGGITGTIQGCNEFLFVYHIMYSTNSFNIRNDCIHGRQYQDPSGVLRAFRLTVICTYMMLKRLRSLESAAAAMETRTDNR